MWTCLLISLSLTPAQDASPAEEKPAPDRWFLMKALEGTCVGSLLDSNKIQVSGWFNSAFTGSSSAHDQLPIGFNYRANELHLQQGYARIEKAVDQNSKTCDFGFRFDTLAGLDYRFTIARGLFDSQLSDNNGEPNTYGIDPVQFYAEAYLPHVGGGTGVKLGRFFAQFGLESIDTTQNALASHSYLFIYNPFTHTGLLTSTKLSETWSVQNGIVTGSDVFIDPASNPTYLGSIKWAPPKGKASVLLSVILGEGKFDQQHNFHNPEIVDVVFTYKATSCLTYTLDALYGCTYEVPNIGFANWYALANYLTWSITPCLSATTRLEFFDDCQGQRTGFEGLYTAATAGLTYKPCKAVSLRPEIRYDYNGETRPFENKHGVVTAAFDVLVRW